MEADDIDALEPGPAAAAFLEASFRVKLKKWQRRRRMVLQIFDGYDVPNYCNSKINVSQAAQTADRRARISG